MKELTWEDCSNKTIIMQNEFIDKVKCKECESTIRFELIMHEGQQALVIHYDNKNEDGLCKKCEKPIS